MKSSTTVIEIKYYEPYFEREEIDILQNEFSQLGNVRIREFVKELGGDETNLWIAVQWIGLGYLGGIIQHLAAKHFEKILETVNQYRKKCKSKNVKFEKSATLILSYDDLDVNITLPSETNIHLLNGIMQDIGTQISGEFLSSKNITQVYLPYLFDEGEKLWRQTFDWSEVKFTTRYWGVKSNQFLYQPFGIEDIYDSEEKRLLKVSPGDIFDNVI